MSLSTLGLQADWHRRVQAALPSGEGRPIQVAALRGVVRPGRRSLVVSAPTGSGKSAVGDLVILDALARGRAAALVVPLRALAVEKHSHWRGIAARLHAGGLGEIRVACTTGDLHLEGRRRGAAADRAAVTILTPERLDGLLRRADPLLDGLDAIVVDEAHLLRDPARGPNLETCIARLRLAARPPRFVLLSASLGDPAPLASWLDADVLAVDRRSAPLDLEIGTLEDGEDRTEAVAAEVRAARASARSVLVFVETRADAERLAAAVGAVPFHAGLHPDRRHAVSEGLRAGRIDGVVSTTALAQGVDLPANQVVVAHPSRRGRPVPAWELSQMLGRAGRGGRGLGLVIVSARDAWDPDGLGRALGEPPPAIRSSLGGRRPGRGDPLPAIAAALLTPHPRGRTATELQAVLGATLAGRTAGDALPQALETLLAPAAALAWRDDDRIRLTSFGRATSRAQLPLDLAIGFGHLVRDLLELDAHALLARWTPWDHALLVAVHLGLPEVHPRRDAAWHAPQAALADLLVQRPAALLGSMRARDPDPASRLKRAAQQATAALDPDDDDVVRDRYGLAATATRRRARDELRWLGRGLADLARLRCVHHHLVHRLGAGPQQLVEATQALRMVRRAGFALAR